MYALSRYDDVRTALADTDAFSSTQGVGYERRPVPMMIAYDPPRAHAAAAHRGEPLHAARARAMDAAHRTTRRDLLDPLLSAGPLDLVATWPRRSRSRSSPR